MIDVAADSDAQDRHLETKANDNRLRDLPADENRQRWLIICMWPKLIKSQKAALQDIWSGSPEPATAIRAFAARDEDSHLKVISAATELLETGILAEAPPMPWDGGRPVPVRKPNLSVVPIRASRAQASDTAESNPAALLLEFPRARLDLVIPTLTREYKPATRLSMEKGFSRLSDEDLWRSLCGTFTEGRVREALNASP
jgi:hypothetical protein